MATATQPLLGLSLGALVFLFPFYCMVVGTLQREPNSDESGAFPNPAILTLDNLRDINQAINLPRTLLNSGIFTGGVLLCTLLLGYSLARLEFRGVPPGQPVRGHPGRRGQLLAGRAGPGPPRRRRAGRGRAARGGPGAGGALERLGPVGFAFEPGLRTDLNLYPNKDALLFPEPVPGPGGEPAFALLHRPMWDLSWVNPAEGDLPPPGLPDPRPGIWVPFTPAKEVLADPVRLTSLRDHRLVALPERPWEEAKPGGGTPPRRVGGGWLVLHHGVAGRLEAGRVDHQPAVRYSAGAMLLDPGDVTRVVARSAEPLLEPELAGEREGVVPNVVFPTAIDRRSEHEADVYYGMADARIGAFRLTMAPLPRE